MNRPVTEPRNDRRDEPMMTALAAGNGMLRVQTRPQ
jgi:hypothetical protein